MSTAPERWLVLTVRIPQDDAQRGLVAEALIELGGRSVLEDGAELSTFLPPPDDLNGFLANARAAVDEWTAPDPPGLTWRWQQDEDWERQWRRGLQPRKVSPRLVVKPSWTEWAGGPDEIVLDIDPQMAFGTGEHATTRGCLRLLDQMLREGARVLDVGSGSAILSIAAARLGAAQVTAIEYDGDANINARENIARNGVADRITLREQLATPELLQALDRFDLILANILSSIIRPLLPAFHDALEPGGTLILSGILKEERGDVLSDAAAAGLALCLEDVEEEWWSAAFKRNDD